MAIDVYVVGMSNTIAVQMALGSYDGPLKFTVDNLTSPEASGCFVNGRQLNPEFFREKVDAKLVAAMFFGMWYNSLALVESPDPFDFMLPGFDVEVDESRRIIPYSQIRRKFDNRLRQQMVPFIYLRRMTPGKMIFLEPQPPIESEDHLKRYHGVFGAMLTLGVTPGKIRLKLWKLQSMIFADICAEQNVDYIPFSAEATSKDGFLEESYCFEDPGHANANYGALAIRQMEAIHNG